MAHLHCRAATPFSVTVISIAFISSLFFLHHALAEEKGKGGWNEVLSMLPMAPKLAHPYLHYSTRVVYTADKLSVLQPYIQPQLVQHDADQGVTLWYVKDNTFKVPTTDIVFQLVAPSKRTIKLRGARYPSMQSHAWRLFCVLLVR